MGQTIWLFITVVFGFSTAIVAAIYASAWIAGLLITATAYVAYVIKSDNPSAPFPFRGGAHEDA